MKLFALLPFVVLLISLSACSNNKTSANTPINKPIENMQKVEMGTIVSVQSIAIEPEKIDSYGNIGVSVGSGGHSGIYGAFDVATIGKIFRNTTKPKTALQLIVKKANGETVAITQTASKEVFKSGDSVKLLLQDGKAKVTH